MPEEIFPGLHIGAVALDPERHIDEQRTVDDAFLLELGEDVRHLGMRRDHQNLVGLERAGGGELFLDESGRDDEAGRHDEQKSQKAAEGR